MSEGKIAVVIFGSDQEWAAERCRLASGSMEEPGRRRCAKKEQVEMEGSVRPPFDRG